jgi:hypothetical protein
MAFSTQKWVKMSKSPRFLPVCAAELIEIRQELVFSLGCFFEEFLTLEGWMNAQ